MGGGGTAGIRGGRGGGGVAHPECRPMLQKAGADPGFVEGGGGRTASAGRAKPC